MNDDNSSFQLTSQILSETHKTENIKSNQESIKEPISLEQENYNPEYNSLILDIESKKVPVHLRQNRGRVPPPRPASNKTAKLNKVHKDLRNILKQSTEKQLMHSKSFELETTVPQKEEYRTLLKRKSNLFGSQKVDYSDLSHINFQQILSVSLGDIKFGEVFPGSIIENDLEIKNKTANNLVIRILVGCKNEDLNALDEYVFSITKVDKFDFNEKLLIVLPAALSTKLVLALKVPNLKHECFISGFYVIEIVGLNKSLNFQLEAEAKIPKLRCLKEIYDNQNKIFLLKFALKKGKKQDFKIFLRNQSEINIEGNFELMENNQTQNEAELMMYPLTAVITGYNTFTLNMMVKPKVLVKPIGNVTTLNKVLLFKVKNSSLIYFFALAIELY